MTYMIFSQLTDQSNLHPNHSHKKIGQELHIYLSGTLLLNSVYGIAY